MKLNSFNDNRSALMLLYKTYPKVVVAMVYLASVALRMCENPQGFDYFRSFHLVHRLFSALGKREFS